MLCPIICTSSSLASPLLRIATPQNKTRFKFLNPISVSPCPPNTALPQPGKNRKRRAEKLLGTVSGPGKSHSFRGIRKNQKFEANIQKSLSGILQTISHRYCSVLVRFVPGSATTTVRAQYLPTSSRVHRTIS